MFQFKSKRAAVISVMTRILLPRLKEKEAAPFSRPSGVVQREVDEKQQLEERNVVSWCHHLLSAARAGEQADSSEYRSHKVILLGFS
jgi:hypothetical protein